MADRLLILRLNTLLEEEQTEKIRQRARDCENIQLVMLNPYVTPLVYSDDNTTIDLRGESK